MTTKTWGAGLLLVPILIAGCTVDTASCNPNTVGNVLTSASCSSQGMFDQRRANLGGNLNTILAEVESERMAISRANSKVRDLQAQQRLSQSQSSSISREIAAMNADVNRLAASGNPAQQAQLRQQVAQRKAAVNAYANTAVF